jgi:hypothetical protein
VASSLPTLGERNVLEFDAEVFRDRLAAGQDRDVLQHGLAAIAEARRLDGSNLQTTAQTVPAELRAVDGVFRLY